MTLRVFVRVLLDITDSYPRTASEQPDDYYTGDSRVCVGAFVNV